MRTSMRAWGCLGLLWLLACHGPASVGAVQVRIQNESGVALKDLWLGAGGDAGSAEHYGPIAVGETTEYRALEPFLSRYRKLDFVTADGKAYGLTVYPEQHLGMRELPGGRYTFTLRLAGARPALRIAADSGR